jgi:hypothetical protein
MLVVDEALGCAEWQTNPGWFVRWVKLAAMVDSLCTFGIQTGRIFWEQVEPQDVPVKNIGSGRKRRTTRKTLLNLDTLQSPIFFSFGFSVFFFQKVGDLAYPRQKIDIANHFLFRRHACLDMANEEHNKHVNRPITWSTPKKDLSRKVYNLLRYAHISKLCCIIFFKKKGYMKKCIALSGSTYWHNTSTLEDLVALLHVPGPDLFPLYRIFLILIL